MILLRKSWMPGAAAILGTVVWFALLGQRPLFDPDEGRYAEIPREMLSGGDWVIPHLNALVYLEKPPLQYWLTAFALRGLGQSEFSARYRTALARVDVGLLGRDGICDAQQGIDRRAHSRRDSGRLPLVATRSPHPGSCRRPAPVLVDYRDEFDLGLSPEPQRGIARSRAFRTA